MSDADWLVPGGVAVMLQPESRGAMRAEEVTIERVLKRDVVLSTGERVRRDRLELKVGGTWGVTTRLVCADDPKVASVRREIAIRNARSKADAAYDQWRRGNRTSREVANAFMHLHNIESLTANVEGR